MTKPSTPSQKFAPIALWVAGAALLMAVVLLVTKLLSYIGLFSISDPKPFNIALIVCASLAILGPAIFTLLNPKATRDFLTGRQARHGSNAVISFLAVLLILILVNAYTYSNPGIKDWTEDKKNSLAAETVNAIKAVPAPVHAIGFFTTSYDKTGAQTLMTNVQSKSAGKFTYEFVDPNSQPAKAQQYKVTQDGTIVLIMNGHQELFTGPTEENFTNSLVKLMNPGERTVYFLTGHGEHNTQSAGDKSYTRVRTVLESKNYTVKTLNLLSQNKIPEDALAVIIAGPTNPLAEGEVTLLKDYVSKGGSLVVLKDPDLTATTPKVADPLENYLTNTWNITIDNDMVIDPSSSQPIVAVEYTYGAHEITNSMNSQNLVAFFPTASSLTLSNSIADINKTALVSSIDRAWGETDIAALQQNKAAFDSSTDIPGPLVLAAAAEANNGKGRVVVVGDSDFASDAYFDQYGNSDMFMNSVDWAAGLESMISLTTKPPVSRTLNIPSSLTSLLLAFVFIIGLPGLVATTGASFWLASQRWYIHSSVVLRLAVSAVLFTIVAGVLDMVVEKGLSIVAILFGAFFGLLAASLSSWIVRMRQG